MISKGLNTAKVDVTVVPLGPVWGNHKIYPWTHRWNMYIVYSKHLSEVVDNFKSNV